MLRIHLDSIEEPNSSDPSMFTPTAERIARGPRAMMVGIVRFPQYAPAPPAHAGLTTPEVVIASLDQDGRVLEAEALQNSDTRLSDVAMAKRAT